LLVLAIIIIVVGRLHKRLDPIFCVFKLFSVLILKMQMMRCRLVFDRQTIRVVWPCSTITAITTITTHQSTLSLSLSLSHRHNTQQQSRLAHRNPPFDTQNQTNHIPVARQPIRITQHLLLFLPLRRRFPALCFTSHSRRRRTNRSTSFVSIRFLS
jgi:hypothetical protein